MKKPYSFEKEEFLDFIFFRQAARFLVSILKHTSITPNIVTLLAVIIGITASFFFFLKEYPYNIIGIVLLCLAIILDCSDGQLARAKKIFSPIGGVIDGIADSIVIFALYFSVTMFYTLEGDYFIWLWGALAAVSHSIQCSIYDFYKNQYRMYVFDGKINNELSYEGLKEKYSKDKTDRKLKRNIQKFHLQYQKSQELYVYPEYKIRYSIKELNETYRSKYRKYNLVLFQFWALVAPTTHLVYFMLFSIFSDFKKYFFFEIIILNVVLIVLRIIQFFISKRLANRYL